MFVKSFIAILLSVLIIGVSSGITLSKHYCGGALESISINKDADCCCDGEGVKSDCCRNEVISFSTDQQFSPVVFDWKLDIKRLCACDLCDWFMAYEYAQTTILTGKNYKPPSLNQDIPVLIQSFLI